MANPQIEIFELLETADDEQRTVFLNTAHIVEVTEEDAGFMAVRMSNGKTHHLDATNAGPLRSLLQGLKSN